jgi:hypothetical protein
MPRVKIFGMWHCSVDLYISYISHAQGIKNGLSLAYIISENFFNIFSESAMPRAK